MDENSDPHGVKKGGRDFGVFFFVSLKKTVKIEGRKKGGVIRIPLDTYQQIESQQTEPAADRLATQGEIAPRLPPFNNPLFSNKFQEVSGGWQAFSPYVPKNTPHVHTRACASSADTRDTHSLHAASKNGELAYCIFLPQKSFGVYAAPCSQSTLAAQLHFTGA